MSERHADSDWWLDTYRRAFPRLRSAVSVRQDGWVQKPLACDFIAYAYAPSGVCYLLPIVPLQRAWRLHGREWIETYGQRRALNLGYVSVSVPGPRDTFMAAIVDAMVVGGDV